MSNKENIEIQQDYELQVEMNRALTEGIHSAYYVDFDKNTVLLETLSNGIRDEFSDFIKHSDWTFSKFTEVYCQQFVHEDDYERMKLELNSEHVMERFKTQHSFYVQYRIKENPVYYGYFEMHAVDASKSADEHKAFFSFRCIDEQKKKEIEQQRELKIYADRAKENLDIINDLFVSGFWYEEFNEQGTVKNIYWSDSFRKILGFSDEKEFPNEVESFLNRVHPDDKTEALKNIDEFIKNKNGYDVTSRIMKKDGKYGWFNTTAKILRYADGKPRLIAGIIKDITESREKDFLSKIIASMVKISFCSYLMDFEENSYSRIQELKEIEDIVKDGPDLRSALKVWLDAVPIETKRIMEPFLTVESMKEHLKDKDKISFEFKGIHGVWTHTSFIVVERLENGDASKVIFMCEDINEEMNKRIQSEMELNKYYLMSYTDKMTGSLNRAAFMRDIEMYEEIGAEKIAVIYADVNGLKITNDAFGHDVGDDLIMNSVKILKKCFGRARDKIYRTGGDEFVILMTNVTEDEFEKSYSDLKNVLVNKKIMSVGGMWSETECDIDKLTRKAEKKMYESKNEYYAQHPELDRRKK